MARLARRDPDSGDDVLVLLPTVEAGGRAREVVQMRSLGYLGSFLLQYTSAQVGASPLCPRDEGRGGRGRAGRPPATLVQPPA